MKHALLSSWLGGFVIYSAFGFTAAAYYPYLLVPAVLALIALDVMRQKKARILLLVGVSTSALVGLVCQLYFWTDKGISGKGFLLAMPVLLVIGVICFSIFRIESKVEA